MLTLIAAIIVWIFIQALCAKNPGPLLILIALLAIMDLIAMFE